MTAPPRSRPDLGPSRHRGVAKSAFLLLAFSMAARAGDAPGRGALVLFDGKTLDGWMKVESFKAGEVRVGGGSILLETGGPMTAVVCTRKDLPVTDYEL